MPDPATPIESWIRAARLLPVVVLDHADKAVPLAHALVAGGLKVAEVTFRSDAAPESIARMVAEVPDILVGAGTVLTPAQVKAAARAGAAFLLTPGFNPDVVWAAQDEGVPIIPGINSPTGVEQALSAGLTAVKFFPAVQTGGIPFLKALTGPYPMMRFCPTGGIGPANLKDWLALPSVLAVGGSWMVEVSLIRDAQFNRIETLTREAVTLAHQS